MIAKSAQEAIQRKDQLRAPSFAAFDISIENALDEITYILGLPLVAAVMGQEPSAVSAWCHGTQMTDAQDVTLRTALHASRMISCRLPASIVRRWFISPCDEILGRSPLEELSKMAEHGSADNAAWDTKAKIMLAADRYWKNR